MIRLIFNSYIRQEARVSWGSHFSCYFHLRNGVKQGGVISAQLFTVYIDKLLLDLKHSGYGCHLGDTFTGVLSNADDITLICPSLRGMNCMLKICSDFAENFSLTFNSNKSMCIKFGESVNDREKIMLNDLQIAWVNDVRHLGNYINKSLSDKLDCQQKVSTFIGSVNKLNANFRNLQHDVIARLFKSHCCSFYGSQAWRIDSPDYKRICISWNKSVRTFYVCHILRIPGFLGHCWDSLIFIVNCNNAPYVFYVQYRITTIFWFLLAGNMQVTMQIHHLVITLHILEIVTVLTFSLMYVLKKLFTLHN